jgi:hypothetical protein
MKMLSTLGTFYFVHKKVASTLLHLSRDSLGSSQGEIALGSKKLKHFSKLDVVFFFYASKMFHD